MRGSSYPRLPNPPSPFAYQPPKAQRNPKGVVQESMDPLRVSKHWVLLFCLIQAGLLVPYLSKAVPWAYENGYFPLRPMFFMLGLGALNLCWILGRAPDFTKTGLLFLALLCIRPLDAALLKRYIFLDGHNSEVLSMGASVFMAVVIFGCFGVMHKTSYRPAIFVTVGTILVCVGSILAEFLGLMQFSIAYGRVAGFSGDPNLACETMLCMLGVYLTLDRRFWPNIAVIGITAVGVFPSLSRGGMMILACIILAYVVMNLQRYFLRLVAIGVAAVPIMIAGVGILMSKASEGTKGNENALSRIEAIFGGDVEVIQSGERMKDLTDGLEAVAAHPLMGMGTGAGTLELQPHNQIISLWVDVGLIGPLLYSAILLVLGFKVLSSGMRGLYALIPLVLYIPLSQTLLQNFAYFYAVAAVIMVTTKDFWSFRLLREKGPLTMRGKRIAR